MTTELDRINYQLARAANQNDGVWYSELLRRKDELIAIKEKLKRDN